MYEVELRVYDRQPREKLYNFLEQTKNFGKKFYHMDKTLRGSPGLNITALAVSRDVTYILRWDISCEQLLSKEAEDDGVMIEDMLNRTFPAWGLEPRDEESKYCFFPLLLESGNNYQNVFYINNFIGVQKLLKDGVDIVEHP